MRIFQTNLLFLTGALLVPSCSDNPTSSNPELNKSDLVPGNLPEPSLVKTLPASWDENWFTSPAVFDLDGDGAKEIIESRHSVL